MKMNRVVNVKKVNVELVKNRLKELNVGFTVLEGLKRDVTWFKSECGCGGCWKTTTPKLISNNDSEMIALHIDCSPKKFHKSVIRHLEKEGVINRVE